MRIKALAAGLVLSWASASLAQTPPPAPPQFKFEMHGFAAGTVFVQDGPTQSGSGQTAIWAANGQPVTDKLMFGGDARESRFNFSVSGPQVFGGATPTGGLEIDWFGNFGAGNFGEVHLVPRLRTAFAQLNWGGAHRIVFGQYYDITGALGPNTLTHIAQPLTLAAGNAGFRRAGVFGFHTFGDLKDKDAAKVEFAWEVGRGAWTDIGNAVNRVPTAFNAAGAPTTVATIGNGIGSGACAGFNGNAPGTAATLNTAAGLANVCTGEASGLPALQARLSFTKGSAFSAYVGGHWNRVDRSGMGIADVTTGTTLTDLDVIAGVAGFKGVLGPVTIAAAGYVGKNDAPLIAAISGSQFTASNDVHEYGGWAQLGFNFTKELSAWGFAGVEKMNDSDIRTGTTGYTISRNINYNGLLQYRDGGYAIGLEYTHFRTTYVAAPVTNAVTGVTTGGLQSVNQLAMTGVYFF